MRPLVKRGTRVTRQTPGGIESGEVIQDEDAFTGKVMVQWDGEGQVRTEQMEELTVIAAPVEPTAQDELREWWRASVERELEPMIAKMEEYGGAGRNLDLMEIGRAMHEAGVGMTGRDGPEGWAGSEAELQELGIYFYLVGKFARWTAAIAEGRQVSDDTLHDIGIYVRMAQRARATGGWPQ